MDCLSDDFILESGFFLEGTMTRRRPNLKEYNWRRGGILSEHPKKFSVVMVKRKPNRINGRFDEKPFCQCNWEI
jgi:hypothetical protein